MIDDIFRGKGVEVRIGDDDNFLKIKETLTRIGIASKKDKTLYQSCHILHKQGRYAIVHFKELFELDGKSSDFSQDDRARRNTIVKLLEEWGLVKIVDPDPVKKLTAPLSQVKILPFKEKSEWTLVAKYTVGKRTNA
jgi:hypothetical protein